jgi:hypothetical protein
MIKKRAFPNEESLRHVSQRKKRLEQHIDAFMRICQRKHVQGELNDRYYNRKFEAQIKRMNPRELNELLHSDASDTDTKDEQSQEEPERQ